MTQFHNRERGGPNKPPRSGPMTTPGLLKEDATW